jgi:hypothetical protein
LWMYVCIYEFCVGGRVVAGSAQRSGMPGKGREYRMHFVPCARWRDQVIGLC